MLLVQSVDGDIFSCGVGAIVNPVNTIGPMGAGLARQFARRFPGLEDWYKRECREGRSDIGVISVYDSGDSLVLNFPTKKHWSNPSEMGYIRDGLSALSGVIESRRLDSVALPALGCGLGSLPWDEVFRTIAEWSEHHPDLKIHLFPPKA